MRKVIVWLESVFHVISQGETADMTWLSWFLVTWELGLLWGLFLSRAGLTDFFSFTEYGGTLLFWPPCLAT